MMMTAYLNAFIEKGVRARTLQKIIDELKLRQGSVKGAARATLDRSIERLERDRARVARQGTSPDDPDTSVDRVIDEAKRAEQ